MPPPPSPNIALEFAHHNGDEVLNCPGAKWHLAQAFLVVYSEEPASNILQSCTVILDAECCTNWHGIVKHKSISAKEYEVP